MLAFPMAATSQTPASVPQEQMRKLDFLVGDWKGKGWMYRVDGSRVEFSQSAKVKGEPDSSMLSVKGMKRYKVNFPSFSYFSRPSSVTIFYDEGANLYRWRPKNSKNPFKAKLIDSQTLRWEMEFYGGNDTRTTIKVTEDGEWHETLELLLTTGWFKAEESVIKRVK